MKLLLSVTVASLVLLADPSSSSTLRSVSQNNRRLSYELIASFEPKSQVTDHNAIDLDQATMEDQLAIGTDVSFERARRVYEEGGHSKSVAMVKLSSPLTSGLKKATAVSGKNDDGAAVYGKLYEDYPNGSTTIGIQYKTTDNQKSYVGCQVGGLPKQNTAGCLSSSGTLSIDGTKVQYSYDPKTANINKRTIQKFSTDSEAKMYRCENCPYDTYRKFREYYGHFDYADKWIQAAFDGRSTELSNGNANFVRYGFKGRTEAIKKATAYMSIWMYVIREMEDALDDCQNGCKTTACNEDPVHAWDEAVAFYTGSLEGVDGANSGKLLHALADKRCENFKTCGPLASSTEGSSHVNLEIFRDFALGSRKLAAGQCADVKPHKERIERMMAIPLVQGTLRYAYITSNDGSSGEKAEAEGAVFAASVLPLVHACDEDAAAVIYDNLRTGQANSANFAQVKTAFESVYTCMGIRPSDVGGLWNADTGDYFVGAQPTKMSSKRTSGSVNLPLIIGCTAGGVVAGIIIYLLMTKCFCNNKAPLDLKEDPLASIEEPAVVETGAEDSAVITNEEDPLPSTNSEMEPVEIS